MMMKSILRSKINCLVLVALCSTAFCAVNTVLCDIPAMAQDASSQGSAPSGPPPDGRGPGGDMEARRLEMLTKHLSLTTEQQTQVKAILDDQKTQMEALRNDTSTSREEKRPKMMALRKASDDKIRALLTDEQKTKFDAMQAEMRDHMRQGPPPQQ